MSFRRFLKWLGLGLAGLAALLLLATIAVYALSALQRAFRNINVGAQHASLDFDTGAEQYGRMLLGSRPSP